MQGLTLPFLLSPCELLSCPIFKTLGNLERCVIASSCQEKKFFFILCALELLSYTITVQRESQLNSARKSSWKWFNVKHGWGARGHCGLWEK